MYSLRHVFWRGAMALSLLALGVGSGFGFQQEPLARNAAPGCDSEQHATMARRALVDDRALALVTGVRDARMRG